MRFVLLPFTRRYAQPMQVSGIEHLTEVEGACILAANHTGHFDGLLILASLPASFRRRLVVTVAADVHSRSRIRAWVFSLLLGGVPMEREASPVRSLRQASRLLHDGWSLLIFPEGRLSASGELEEFKPGAGLLARATALPVIPVQVTGSRDVLPPWGRWPRRASTSVSFGCPIRIETQSYQDFAAQLRQAVKALENLTSQGEDPNY